MTKWKKGNPIWAQDKTDSIEHAHMFTKPLDRLMDDVDRLMSCLGSCQDKDLEIRPTYVVINNSWADSSDFR
ncbi:hypothetical protein ABE871_17370 [Enterococcus gilvus]|uniref:hypothetical protein n=1 Tax=Enterococcus gilvus TaxID=160453 RepID=UPI003D6A440D